jgi:hypothetical protein
MSLSAITEGGKHMHGWGKRFRLAAAVVGLATGGVAAAGVAPASAGVGGPAFYVDGQVYRTVGTPTNLSGTVHRPTRGMSSTSSSVLSSTSRKRRRVTGGTTAVVGRCTDWRSPRATPLRRPMATLMATAYSTRQPRSTRRWRPAAQSIRASSSSRVPRDTAARQLSAKRDLGVPRKQHAGYAQVNARALRPASSTGWRPGTTVRVRSRRGTPGSVRRSGS